MTNQSTGSDDSGTMKRRKVLQSVGAAGATVGMSGLSSATVTSDFSEAEVEAAKEGYRNVDAVKEAISQHPDLLEALSEEGIAEKADIESLGIESFGHPNSRTDPFVDITTKTREDELVPDVRISSFLDEGLLAISIKPDTDEAFALFKPENAADYQEVYSNSGCSDDCDDCEITCNPVNETVYCQGYDTSEPEYICNDGW